MSGKYYIAVDCEGLACAVGAPNTGMSENCKNIEFARLQATREANSAAKALFDSGADTVVIWDAHGSGVNLHYDLLDERCQILLGCGHKGRFVGIDESFDGVLFIGYHAKAGTKSAVLSHTMSSKTYKSYKINGNDVGELEIDAAYAGAHGVPVIFASSDDICINQAKKLFPNIRTVVTKKSLSWSSALSLHPKKVCDLIYENVLLAVKDKEKCSSFMIDGKILLTLEFKTKEQADQCTKINSLKSDFLRTDDFTCSYSLEKITDLY